MPAPVPSQKARVLDLLSAASRPLSADEVRQDLGPETIGQATVYRAIRDGLAAGDLRAVEVPGSTPRYETAGRDHHHHFSCSDCGRVYDVFACPGALDELLPEGFALERHEVLLYGRCRDCA